MQVYNKPNNHNLTEYWNSSLSAEDDNLNSRI